MDIMTQFLDVYASAILYWSRWIFLALEVLGGVLFIGSIISRYAFKKPTEADFEFLLYGIMYLGVAVCFDVPMFWMSMAYVFAVYMLLFPILLTPKPKLFTYLFKPLAILSQIIYLGALFYNHHYEGFEWFWRLALLIGWFLVCYVLIWLTDGSTKENICTHCGRFGDNVKEDTRWEDDGCEYIYYKCAYCGETYRVKINEKKKEEVPESAN